MTVSLTVIVPTCGRPSLREVLRDLSVELSELDEVLVAGDGPQPEASKIVQEIAPGADVPIRYFETKPTRCFGNSQRQEAIGRARGTHLWFVDDDDRVIRGATSDICTKLKDTPSRPHMFRMWHSSGLIWRTPQVLCGNVSSQTFVVPNDPKCLGRWTERYEGDFDFISSTVILYPGIVWVETPVVVHGQNGSLAPHPPGALRNSMCTR